MQARASLFAAALAAGTFAVAAPAQANWSDNFDDGDTAGWMFLGNAGTPKSDISVVGGELIMRQSSYVNPLGSDFDQWVTGVQVSETFTDVVVRATITPQQQVTLFNNTSQSNNYVFVAARTDTNGNGYLLAFDWGERDLNLFRAENGVPYDPAEFDPSTPAATRLHGIDLTQTYVLELTIVGNNLTGRFYDATGTTLIGEVTWTDNAYTQGYAGVGAAINPTMVETGQATFIAAGFDNVSASAIIPEPASLALVGLGAMLVMGKRRR